MNIAALLLNASERTPAQCALTLDGFCLNYGDLGDCAQRVAGLLRARGVHRGDRVALFLPNGVDFVATAYGVLSLGAIMVSIGSTAAGEEADHALRDSGANIVVTNQELARRLAQPNPATLRQQVDIICVDGDESGASENGDPRARWLAAAPPFGEIAAMDADDPASIVYSSGTTGRPKGVVLSHANVSFVARAKVEYLAIAPQDRLLLFLPMHHCFGQNAVMHAAVAAGATVVVLPRFEPERVLACLAGGEVTMVFGVPSTFLALIDRLEPDHLRTVRYVFSAAASLPRALEERWLARFGLPIHQGYGLSESSPFASYNHADGPRPGTVGTPIRGVAMAIADPDTGMHQPPGVAGEILIRGPNVMLGYWDRPEETAQTIRDGWLHSGDIGRMDADGFFTVEDRVKDMIVVGGENVYPAEVENVIHRHEGVAEVAVFGVAEPYLGEEVRARIVPRPGARLDAGEIVTLCRAHLAPFKVPSLIEFAEDLPKSPTGKVLKRILRAEAAAADAAAGPGESVDVGAFVDGWQAERLGLEPGSVDPARPFVDYGVDSALGVALARDLGVALELDLDPTLVWEYPSIQMLAKGILARQHPSADVTV